MAQMFRKDFLYGFATAAAQIEGGGQKAELASGRGLSIWDEYCSQPGRIDDGSSVMRTCNHLGFFKEDIRTMASLGMNSYRFSISWPRILPQGAAGSQVNETGVRFYNDIINECLAVGITPFVTLYHWDLPLSLHHEYDGWTSRRVIDDYVAYANLCFELFGDRVKHWLTFNEPWCIAVLGYGKGAFAPGRTCHVDPWLVGHNVILSHAKAARLYRKKWKPEQGGVIGITLNGDWVEPFDNSPENVEAAQRKMDVAVGWFADPIYLGRYPESMVEMLGNRLPRFTDDEMAMVHRSSDFYGCNTYTTNTVKAGGNDEFNGNAILGFDRADGTALASESELGWLRDVPWGFRKLLNYLYDRYKLPIYCTENGYAIKGESSWAADYATHDLERVRYYQGYLQALKEAVTKDGVDVRSYFAWTFMDNFEWQSGLRPRFGLVHTNYETFERTPKESAKYYAEWCRANFAGEHEMAKASL